MATIIKPEIEPETEDQVRPWEGTAGVGELTLEGPTPTLGGRAQATYRRTHDQLRALGLDPDQVLGPPDPVGGLLTLTELTKFLKGPRVAEMTRRRQLAAAQRRFGYVDRDQFREACKIAGTRKAGRRPGPREG